MIRKQTPVRDGTTNEQLAIRTERYFYDGARRIQEVATVPIVEIDPEPEGGGLTLAEEMELLEGESEANIFVDREYVYVPSGASGYVDEFICQIDRYQDLWYILQDVNYNVIALTDSGGEVVRQHTFDPYGEILTAEDFDTHPGIKVGHQGLFFDRLEPSAPAGGLISMSAAVQLQPGVFGLYQARNRVLLPRYGRWAQKDPNASGMLHTTWSYAGTAFSPLTSNGDIKSILRDGSNLFAYIRTSPLNGLDSTGLFATFGDIGAATQIRSDLQQDQFSNQLDAIEAVGNLFGFDDGGLIDFVQGISNVVGVRTKDDYGNITTQYSHKLTATQKNILRKQYRKATLEARKHKLPKGTTVDDYDVHHEIPLEWSHLFPMHPCASSNLVVLDKRTHNTISGEWNTFRARHARAQSTPSPLAIIDFAAQLQTKYGRQYIR